MTTGNFENWAGNIADIGAAYPFVGTEFLLWILGMLFWIGWHVLQMRDESRQWEEDLRQFGGKGLPREEYLLDLPVTNNGQQGGPGQ